MKLMGRALALFLAGLTAKASGLVLFSNATRGFLGITPMAASSAAGEAEGSSIPDPMGCTCDSCVSAHRTKPTAVSDTKCVPSFNMPIGQSCNPKGKFPAKTHDTDVPYQLFCMCSCQPFLKTKSKLSVTSDPPACIAFSADEKKMVDHPDGESAENCEDPKFPTQMEQNAMNMDAGGLAKLSKTAGTPAPKEATKELKEQVKKVLANTAEAKRQAEAAKTAHNTQRMLATNPVFAR